MQLPPVGNTPLFKPMSELKTAVDIHGRVLWELMTEFYELTTNHRFISAGGLISRVCPAARLGEHVSNADLDLLNKNVAPTLSVAAARAHPRALWIAATNKEVEEINAFKLKQLTSAGRPTVRVWAQHFGAIKSGTRAARPDVETRKRLLMMRPLDEGDFINSLGIGRNYIDYCMEMRVRVNQNLSITDGLFQGAMGTGVPLSSPQTYHVSIIMLLNLDTVVGFGCGDEGGLKTAEEIAQMYSKNRNSDAAAVSDTKPLIVFVQMDSELDPDVPPRFKSAFEHMRGVVAFSAMAQERDIERKFTRFQLPIVPAFATTYHKAQGVTAKFGLVMQPPKLGQRGGIELGMSYVGG